MKYPPYPHHYPFFSLGKIFMMYHQFYQRRPPHESSSHVLIVKSLFPLVHPLFLRIKSALFSIYLHKYQKKYGFPKFISHSNSPQLQESYPIGTSWICLKNSPRTRTFSTLDSTCDGFPIGKMPKKTHRLDPLWYLTSPWCWWNPNRSILVLG